MARHDHYVGSVSTAVAFPVSSAGSPFHVNNDPAGEQSQVQACLKLLLDVDDERERRKRDRVTNDNSAPEPRDPANYLFSAAS